VHTNLLRILPWKSLSVIAIIVIGWFLRERSMWGWRDENYVIRAHKGYYVDPTNVYKYYGSYGQA
jgi:hypothetical protein